MRTLRAAAARAEHPADHATDRHVRRHGPPPVPPLRVTDPALGALGQTRRKTRLVSHVSNERVAADVLASLPQGWGTMRNAGYRVATDSNAETGASGSTGMCTRPLVATWQ